MANATPTQQQMAQSSSNAGSLDDVTEKLAARLATQGGSDSEWQLLAESYDYMGRTAEAKAARAHSAPVMPPGEAQAGDAAAAGSVTGERMAATTAATGTAQISGTVEIASQLATHVAAAGATLFIYAKQPDAPGPPLAVVRLHAEHWPVTFTLNDANAMVPGRNLSSAQSVQIEARISKSGAALPQAGDLVGSVTSVNPRGARPVKISIDREIG
jgi:cytochrome c-type biogenesis protein CcmH